MIAASRRQFLARSAAVGAAAAWSLGAEELPLLHHLVRRGETLSGIARMYGASIRELKVWNGLVGDLILPGQRLELRPQYRLLPLADIVPPKFEADRWRHLILHHSATTAGSARVFHDFHLARGMENGLAYHFVVGNGSHSRDGEVEVGRRWTLQLNGGHVGNDAYNANSIGICLVGNFERTHPSDKQLGALVELLDYLKNKTLRGRARLLLHRDLEQTLCPGRHFPAGRFRELFG